MNATSADQTAAMRAIQHERALKSDAMLPCRRVEKDRVERDELRAGEWVNAAGRGGAEGKEKVRTRA